jgi:hypothetical protein
MWRSRCRASAQPTGSTCGRARSAHITASAPTVTGRAPHRRLAPGETALLTLDRSAPNLPVAHRSGRPIPRHEVSIVPVCVRLRRLLLLPTVAAPRRGSSLGWSPKRSPTPRPSPRPAEPAGHSRRRDAPPPVPWSPRPRRHRADTHRAGLEPNAGNNAATVINKPARKIRAGQTEPVKSEVWHVHGTWMRPM